MKKIICVLILSILCISYLFSAQDGGPGAENQDNYYIDFAVPDLSAFSLLNTKPVSSSLPGYLKEFAVQLSYQSLENLAVPPGFGVQWSPLYSIAEKEVKSVGDYRLSRFLQGIQLTGGTMKNSQGSHLALGMKMIILDESDPILNPVFRENLAKLLDAVYDPSVIKEKEKFLNSNRNPLRQELIEFYTKGKTSVEADSIRNFIMNIISDSLNTIARTVSDNLFGNIERKFRENVDPEFSGTSEMGIKLKKLVGDYQELMTNTSAKRIRFSYQDSVKKLKEKYMADNWNKLGASISGGYILSSDDNSWGNLQGRKFSWVANLMLPSSLFIKNTDKGFGAALVAYCQHNIYSLASNDSVRYDLSAGGRLIAGISDSRFSMDYLYTYFNYRTKAVSNGLKLMIGYEFKVSDGVWLEIMLGSDNNNGQGKSRLITLTNFKYTLIPKPRI